MSKDSDLMHRSDYPHWLRIQTRWMDNDSYGHVNNVQYYSFFDTVINDYLIRNCELDPANSKIIGVAVETYCQFHSSLEFPEPVAAGLRVSKLGNSSVRYEVGIFGEHADAPAATGHFVHVFVDAKTRRPAKIPAPIRNGLAKLVVH